MQNLRDRDKEPLYLLGLQLGNQLKSTINTILFAFLNTLIQLLLKYKDNITAAPYGNYGAEWSKVGSWAP